MAISEALAMDLSPVCARQQASKQCNLDHTCDHSWGPVTSLSALVTSTKPTYWLPLSRSFFRHVTSVTSVTSMCTHTCEDFNLGREYRKTGGYCGDWLPRGPFGWTQQGGER